jgi:CBS domain-containing protein
VKWFHPAQERKFAMDPSMIVTLLVLGVVLVLGSLLLRVFTGGKYEIKTIDLVFLIIPLLTVALATGKIKGLDMFGVRADLSALWSEVANTKIEKQVAPSATASVQDAVSMVEMAGKGGVNELQRMIERKVEALQFKLGYGGYYGPAIKAYFDALSGSSYLRVVVIDHPDGGLFGIYDAADLIGYLRVGGEQGYAQFQRLLNAGNAAAQAELAKLPGFVGADQAVTISTSKRDALARMEAVKTDSLPVVNEQKRFVGTVGRNKLTASLILAVTDRLEGR